MSAGWVLGEMEFAGNRMNIVILDACRNNPLTRRFRSATRGLARMNAPRGSLVAYSTGPGEVARDGDGADSPYTTVLTREFKIPGVSIEQVFKRVRIAVMAETNDEQVPWESSSLTGEFYVVPVAASAATSESAGAIADTEETERLFWETIRESDNSAMFEEYLRQYPDGRFAGLANIKLDRLRNSAELALADQARELGDSSAVAAQNEQVALATGGSVDQEGDNDDPWQTANEIRVQLIGNGSMFKGYNSDTDVNWRERYESDGTILGRARNWKYTGKWWFKGDMMCFDYDADDEYDGCSYIAIDGDSTKWWNTHGRFWDRPDKVMYAAP